MHLKCVWVLVHLDRKVLVTHLCSNSKQWQILWEDHCVIIPPNGHVSIRNGALIAFKSKLHANRGSVCKFTVRG